MTIANDYRGQHDTSYIRGLFGNLIPKPAGLGIIKGLAELAQVMRTEGRQVITLDAGLPSHDKAPQIQEELEAYSKDPKGPYSRYPFKPGAISEKEILPLAADFHQLVTGIETDPSRLVLTEGSTPALNHLIRMMALQKAKDGGTLGEDTVLEIFELSYPLYPLPAEDVGMSKSPTIKIRTEIDVVDGQPVQSKPMQLVRDTVTSTFKGNRDKVTTFVFSNPANPSGYLLSREEIDFIAQELFEDFTYRREHGLPAKLVLEDIAYLTMVHDDNHVPYTLRHAFDNMRTAELKKETPDDRKLQRLVDCRETIMTVHSLSKAAGAAGDRIAYVEGNPVLVDALREIYTRDMLSYSNAGLHAARGAFSAGKPDRTVMKEYSIRVQTLENGVNEAYFKALAQHDIALTREELRTTMPFPAKSGGSFFTIMNLKPLVGEEVPEDFVNQVKGWIGKISNEGIRNSFGAVFKGNKIHESDLPLYMMFKTLEHGGVSVSAVPLMDGMVRFALGTATVEVTQKAAEAIGKVFMNDPVYITAVRNYGKKLAATTATKSQATNEKPGTETSGQLFKIDPTTLNAAAVKNHTRSV